MKLHVHALQLHFISLPLGEIQFIKWNCEAHHINFGAFLFVVVVVVVAVVVVVVVVVAVVVVVVVVAVVVVVVVAVVVVVVVAVVAVVAVIAGACGYSNESFFMSRVCCTCMRLCFVFDMSTCVCVCLRVFLNSVLQLATNCVKLVRSSLSFLCFGTHVWFELVFSNIEASNCFWVFMYNNATPPDCEPWKCAPMSFFGKKSKKQPSASISSGSYSTGGQVDGISTLVFSFSL